MFYFTCIESKIYESFTFWNKLQEKMNFFTTMFIYLPTYLFTLMKFMQEVLICI